MNLARLRLVADQFMLSTLESNAGAAVFELGTVQGVSGLMLKKTRVGDAKVKTIHLKNESVTIPAFSQLASNFDTTLVGTFETFAEQNISAKGVAGSSIFVLLLQQGTITVNGGGNCFVRALLNDSEVLVNKLAVTFPSPGGTGPFQRISMAPVTATGSTQTLNIKWQVLISPFTARVHAGTRVMSIAMKR